MGRENMTGIESQDQGHGKAEEKAKSGKKRVLLEFEAGLLSEVEGYRFRREYGSRHGAIVALIAEGLRQEGEGGG